MLGRGHCLPLGFALPVVQFGSRVWVLGLSFCQPFFIPSWWQLPVGHMIILVAVCSVWRWVGMLSP